MHTTVRKPKPRVFKQSWFNRLLTGESGKAVEVEVEVLDRHTPEMIIRHKLETMSDFDGLDFFLPLFLLLLIFVLTFMGSMLMALFFQLVLLYDLYKRVRRRPSGKKVVGLVAPFKRLDWGWSLLVYGCCLPMILAANRLSEEILAASMATGLMALGGFMVLIFFVETVVLAPITEEIWFRGIGLAGFMKKTHNPAWAAFWTSLIFGILHGPSRFLFTTIFGMALAFIRFRTGSLYCCIFIHALHNFLVVAYAIFSVWQHMRGIPMEMPTPIP